MAMPRASIRVVEIVDVEHPRGQVVDVGRGHAADVGGDGRDPLQGEVPVVVDRFGGQRERCGRQVEEAVGVGGVEPPWSAERSASSSSSGPNRVRAPMNVLQPRLGLRVEEAPVGGDQHRGEHPERVERQLVGIDGAEGGGDHGHRALRRVPQVVEADRVHPEAGEHPGGLGQLPRRADPDRAVPLRGDPVDAAEPLGVGAVGGDEVGVHLAGDVDQGVVRGHLGPVQAGQAQGELGPQVGEREGARSGMIRAVVMEGCAFLRWGAIRGTQMMWISVSSAPVPNRSALNAVGSRKGSLSR